MNVWPVVEPSSDAAAAYRRQGWWDGGTLPSVLARALTESADRGFTLHSRVNPWRGTISDVASLGRRLAAGLLRRGVGAGDPVAFQLPNSVEAAATFYGLALLGAVLVPIGHSAGVAELRHAVRQSGARALLVANGDDGLPIDRSDSCFDGPLELLIAVGGGKTPRGVLEFDVLVDVPALDEPASVDPAQPAVIGWTSGTTGEPKGVMLSHRALCAETKWHMAPMMKALSHRLASTSPISHVTGMLVSILVPPLLGREIHLLDYWDPSRVLDLMTKEHLSAGTGAPLFLSSLIDHPQCTAEHHALIKASSLGGAAVAPELILKAHRLDVAAFRGYGCTEHPTVSLGLPQYSLNKRAYTDGKVCPGVDVRIVADDGQLVSGGESGEVLTRGPDLFSGYTDPALNGAAFAGDWYRTGDIGRLDSDGFLTIVDRKKDIIIRAGMNISAAEVESALLSMPQIVDIAVVAAPDARTGEHACAFIRLTPGHERPTIGDIGKHLGQAGMAKYKWPEEIRVSESDFPRTAAGKVRKADLRAELRP